MVEREFTESILHYPSADDGSACVDDTAEPSCDEPAAETDILGHTDPVDEFEADSDDLNRQVFDAADHHAKAVAEMGYTHRSDNEPPAPSAHRARPASFGVTSAHPTETHEREEAMKKIIRSLDPKAREWCRLCLEEEVDPVDAYKQLGIDKNFYYKKFLPMLKTRFAEWNW